jgi:hypothetical protein
MSYLENASNGIGSYLKATAAQYSLDGSIELLNIPTVSDEDKWIVSLVSIHAKFVHFEQNQMLHLLHRIDQDTILHIKVLSQSVNLGILKTIAKRTADSIQQNEMNNAA